MTLGVGEGFLNRTYTSLPMKEENDKWNVTKLRNICLLEDADKQIQEKSQTGSSCLQYLHLTEGP